MRFTPPMLASRHLIPQLPGRGAASGSKMGATHMRTRAICLGAALALGLATAAAAAGITPVLTSKVGSNVTTVAEGCGRGEWRDEHGRCHPMFNGRACPPGYHLGPEGKRCHPN